MLTVLAIVHRTGVRLPDHRVELYSHATQVLVERWNQVRSLGTPGGAVPIKAADAARLLGPVALAVVRSEIRGAIPEDMLRHQLERAIEAGRLRALTSADEALALFQRSLGLLVEQAPGMYAFLHLTLAEYFAAWELVRTNELEHLIEDPAEVFLPRWRETVLLAAGVLGVLHADDVRLDEIVRALIASSGRRKGKPAPAVPSLLAGLLADDPGLSQRTAEALVDCLIPTWWFERQYGITSMEGVFHEALNIIWRLQPDSRFQSLLHARLRHHYEGGLSPAMQANIARDRDSDRHWLRLLKSILFATEIDESGIFFQLCGHGDGEAWLPWPLVPVVGMDETTGEMAAEIIIGRRMAEAVQRGALRLTIAAMTDDGFAPWQGDWEQLVPAAGEEHYVSVPPKSKADAFLLREMSEFYIHDVEMLGPLKDQDGHDASNRSA
jgi:hypothetical protein